MNQSKPGGFNVFSESLIEATSPCYGKGRELNSAPYLLVPIDPEDSKTFCILEGGMSQLGVTFDLKLNWGRHS